jgi:hypothetical protein
MKPMPRTTMGVAALLTNALALAVPGPGAQVPATIAVPNLPTLFGADVWLQAVQLAGSTIRASTAVGGAIR